MGVDRSLSRLRSSIRTKFFIAIEQVRIGVVGKDLYLIRQPLPKTRVRCQSLALVMLLMLDLTDLPLVCETTVGMTFNWVHDKKLTIVAPTICGEYKGRPYTQTSRDTRNEVGFKTHSSMSQPIRASRVPPMA